MLCSILLNHIILYYVIVNAIFYVLYYSIVFILYILYYILYIIYLRYPFYIVCLVMFSYIMLNCTISIYYMLFSCIRLNHIIVYYIIS